MFLKNYTSDVPVDQTIARIEKVLLRCGVTSINKEYGIAANIIALTFKINTPSGPAPIRFPVNDKAAIDALWLAYADGDKLTADGQRIQWGSRKSKSRADFVEQGSRTAWKIMQDWIEVQMSLIQLKQAEPMEIFLPYIFDGQRTYFQAMKDSGFAGLLPEKGSE